LPLLRGSVAMSPARRQGGLPERISHSQQDITDANEDKPAWQTTRIPQNPISWIRCRTRFGSA